MEPKDFYNKSSYAEYEEVNTIVDYLHVLRARDANILPAMWDGYPATIPETRHVGSLCPTQA